MKTLLATLSLSIILSVLLTHSACAAQGTTSVVAGARIHKEHSSYTDLPYDDGDISYLGGVEWHEGDAYWQLAVMFTPEVTGSNDVKTVITPQLNLMLCDDFWRGGVGALWSLIEDDEGESDWLDMYWQMMIGISLPISPLTLDAFVIYVFEDWNEISEFDLDDVELGLWLTYSF